MPKVFKLQQLGNVIQQILNAVSGKAEQSDLNAHTGDGNVHVSTTEKNRWNDTYTKTQVDERIEQGGKVKTVSVNGGSAVQPDTQGNIDLEVPTDLKDLNGDSTHRTVTDAEKSAWSGKQPAGDYATRTELAGGLATKQPTGDYATNLALTEGLAGKQGTINDLDAIRSGAGKGATSVQGVKMEGDDNPLSPDGNGVVTIPQPEVPDSVTSVITNNELVFQTPDGQSVKGKVGITTGADGLLHLSLTDEEGNTYSSPIAGLRVKGNALQYSNDGETWATVQTFGKLAIKYVQASDPASGDEGDLALVGSTNAYVLKVYVGGSWVSVADFGTLDLTSDGIIMAGESKTLTQVVNEIKDNIAFASETKINSETGSLTDASKYVFFLYGFSATARMTLVSIETTYQSSYAANDKLILFVANAQTGVIKSKHTIEFDGTAKRTIDLSSLNIILEEGDAIAYASGVATPTYGGSSLWNTILRRVTNANGYAAYYKPDNGIRDYAVGRTLPKTGGTGYTGYPPFKMVFKEGYTIAERVEALEQASADVAEELDEIENVIPMTISSGGTYQNPSIKVFAFYGLSVPSKMNIKRITKGNATSGSLILFIVDKDTTVIKSKNVIEFDGTTNEVDVSSLGITIDINETFAYATSAQTADALGVVYTNSNGYSFHTLSSDTDRNKSVGEALGKNTAYIRTGNPCFNIIMESDSIRATLGELEEQVKSNTASIESMGGAATANKTLVVLGDSITWLQLSASPLRGWLTYFKEKILFKGVRNYALSGAAWTNTGSTQVDLTTSETGTTANNVIFNQMNRLINDVDNNGADAPDYIMILAGINDAYFRGDAALYNDFAQSDWATVGGSTPYIGNRVITTCTSIYKSMRYVAEMIWSKFPYAQVMVTTPLQSESHEDARRTICELIKKSSREFAWVVIDQDESNLSLLKEKIANRPMTADGLHPTEKGAEIIGNWLASQFKANMA